MIGKPDIKTFLIADNVIQEKHTNKWSAIGIFNKIYAPKFPAIHANMALYIKMTDVPEGEHNVTVEFVDSSNKKLGFFGGIKLIVKSKLAQSEFGIQTQNLMIPKPGTYHFNFYLDGVFCQNIPVEVEKYEPQKRK